MSHRFVVQVAFVLITALVSACRNSGGVTGENPPPTTPATCEDDCADGSRSCAGLSDYRLCGQFDADTCLEQSGNIACSPGRGCDAGNCVPSCQDDCAAGGTMCDSNDLVVTCGNFDPDLCREFGGASPCGTGNRCEAGGCVPQAQACTDECAAASFTCSGDARRACGQHDNDACLDLGAPVACASGNTCANGACVPACEDECAQSGLNECAGNGTRSCGQHDSDSCLEWSAITACTGNSTCSGGACGTTCTHDCATLGAVLCVNGGYAVCGEFDSDACKDLSTTSPCPDGSMCQNGACVATCADDCTNGAAPRCSGSAIETCGDFDNDPCLEWGGAVPCPGGGTCTNGACDIPCSDECAANGQSDCLSSQSLRTCGQWDLDNCRDWSTATFCEVWETCSSGQCVDAPPPAAILINEALYNPTGTDTAPGNNLFVELWGPADQALDGYELVGINGNGGGEYNRITLDGEVLDANGFFVIAHPDGSLAATADITSANIDFQNGPDSLVLRWYVQTVDALGYGSFGASDVFAGEGTAAASTPAGSSLTRNGTHTDTDDNSADFVATSLPSPRANPPTCTNECTLAATQCSGQQIQTCVTNGDADPCTEWSAPQNCPNLSELCDAQSNTCVAPTCADECTAAAKRCNGNQIETCVTNGDTDPCYEWSAPQNCPNVDQVCQGGQCTVPCAHECPAAAATQCSGSLVQDCGNYDTDLCLEWSAPAACPLGETCLGDGCQTSSAPEVVLIAPQGQVQTTQGATVRMLADATPAPGRSITAVSYYADNALLGTTTAQPHEWFYTVPTNAPTNSTIALQAKATDNQSVTGLSSFAYLDVRNDLPAAAFTATITNTTTVTVDASAVSDTETARANLEVCWDWTNDGSCDTAFSTTKITTHDFGASGTYTVRMVVRDAVAQTAQATREVTFADIQYIGGQTITTTLWYGTIIITGDVTVGSGQTLTIAEGTQVLFVYADTNSDSVGDYTLRVDGALLVNGTATNPVVFTGQSTQAKVPGGWDRIILAGAGSNLQHAIIEYADEGLDILTAATVSDTSVRSSRGDCVQLNNGDNSVLTSLTVSACGDDGVDLFSGSTGVTLSGLTATGNSGHGLRLTSSSSGTVTDAYLANNGLAGAAAFTGSTLNLSDSTLELNSGPGLAIHDSSGGTITHNQIRSNDEEGVRLLASSSDPTPTIRFNNIYSNAVTGSLATTTVSPAGISASQTCCSTSTSPTYTAPSGASIFRVYVSYNETDSSSNTYISGALVNAATNGVLTTFTSDFDGWVLVPAGVDRVLVRVADTGWSSATDTIGVGEVEYGEHTGAADVAAVVYTGTVDMRFNYLGTFPNVLSRVFSNRWQALNLHGFVGAAFDNTWSTGPYKAGAITSETWSGTIYITGDVTIAAGQTVSVAGGTRVLFVDHDQNQDGDGDFSIIASGQLNSTGGSGNFVTFTGYGTPSGNVFQSIRLEGTGANTSTWASTLVEHGRDALILRGGSSISSTTVHGGSGRGIYLDNATGAALTDVGVDGAEGSGIVLANADNATLTRVVSEGHGYHGVAVTSGSTGVILSRLTSRNNAHHGLWITGGSTPVLTDSTVRDNSGDGVRVETSTPTMDYNLIAYNHSAGLAFDGPGGGSAQYNVVKFNDDNGVTLTSNASGSAAPTVQYSNIYGNAVVGSTVLRAADASAALSASQTCCSTSTSATYTAPAGNTIYRVYVSYNETDSSSNTYVSAALVNAGNGASIQSFTSDFTGWLFMPAGVTSLQVRVTDSGWSSTTDTITGTQVELRTIDTAQHYELVSLTTASTSLAKFNYWVADVSQVPSKIFEWRSGAVDYTGYTGAEYPGTSVGPRP